MKKFAIIIAALLSCTSAFAQPVTAPTPAPGAGPITDPFGQLMTLPPMVNLQHDTFDIAFDPLNWATAVFAGTGAAGAVDGGGNRVITSGTAAGGYSYVVGKTAFAMAEPGFIETGTAIKIPVPASLPTNSYWFWGSCTPQAVPTAANPIVEGIVFEIQPGGKMFAASYAGATRTVIADMSNVTGSNRQPIDGSTHFYYNFNRGDLLAWALDNLFPTGYINVQPNGINGPNVNSQPPCMGIVNGLAAPTVSNVSTAPVMNVAASWVAQPLFGAITDGVHPFIKGSVKLGMAAPQSGQSNGVAADNASVTTLAPYNYTNITTDTTTTISATFLHTVCFNTLAATEVVTIFDSATASGTKVGTVTETVSTPAGCLVYDVFLAHALTFLTATAAGDITVSWR
jgi:hypothetical protein